VQVPECRYDISARQVARIRSSDERL